MRFLVLLAALLVAACDRRGEELPGFEHGEAQLCETTLCPSPFQTAMALNVWKILWEDTFYETPRVHGVLVHWRSPESFGAGKPGYAIGRQIFVPWAPGVKIGETSFAHELLHVAVGDGDKPEQAAFVRRVQALLIRIESDP